jgi:hypothetical protein
VIFGGLGREIECKSDCSTKFWGLNKPQKNWVGTDFLLKNLLRGIEIQNLLLINKMQNGTLS